MDEYISRESAVNAGYLSDWYISSVGDEPPIWTDGHIDELLNDFLVIPKDTPVADVQPVEHGKWIEKKVFRMKWIPYAEDDVNADDVGVECMTEQKCSYCKRWTIKFTFHIELDYCPLCGARMDGDNE